MERLLSGLGPSPSPPPRVLEPPWLRPAPPVLAPFPGELKFLHPNLHTELLWDSELGEDAGPGSVEHGRGRAGTVRALLCKALQGPLLPAQQQQVLAELQADPKLIHHIHLTPKQLPALVENTPTLAYEMLVQLMRYPELVAVRPYY